MISKLGNSQYNYSNKMGLVNKNEPSKSGIVTADFNNSLCTPKTKQVSFNGAGMPIVDGTIAFITWMENGGKMVEFTVTDCLSMIFPRTFQAYNRNSKELGHPNYKAGTEEAIREFLTGPSMFLVPLALVGLGKKIFGESSGIGFNTLKKFGETFTGLVATKNNVDKKEFYKTILNEALGDKVKGTYNGKVPIEKYVNVITTHIKKIEQLNGEISKSKEGRHIGHSAVLFIDQKIIGAVDFLANKITKLDGMRKNIKKLIGGNVAIIENRAALDGKVNKSFDRITTIITKLNNLSAKKVENIGHIVSPDSISLSKAGAEKAKQFSMNAKDLVTDLMKFGNDVVVKTGNLTEGNQAELAKKLFSQRHGGRIITIATAIASTGAFLYCIPMLYKRNKQYPGIDGLIKASGTSATSSSTVAAKILNNSLLKVYTASRGGNI